MSLWDIKSKLYKKDFDPEMSRHGQSEFDARAEDVFSARENASSGDEWSRKKEGLDFDQKKAVKWGAIVLGSIAILILLVFGTYRYMQGSFKEERVGVSVSGPQQAGSGKLLSYEISYKNSNRAALKDAVLRVSYPESFQPEQSSGFREEGEAAGSFSLGEIAGGAGGKVILNGRAYSPKGESVAIKADLNYTPANFNSAFSARNQIVLNINSSPVELEILAPQDLAAGDSLDYLVTFKNNGQKDFDNLRVRLDYPEGFTLSASEPKVSEGNNVWYIGSLLAGESRKIVVSGKLDGLRDEIKKVEARIGIAGQDQFIAYSEEKAETRIAASPLSISQLVNGKNNLVINAGETLRFQIRYKNESDTGFRDVIVTEKLQSPVLDFTTLEMKGGAVDQNNSLITWKASDYSQLKFLGPGQEGEISFSIKVKDVIPVVSANDRNFVVSSVAKIDSVDIPTPLSVNKIIAGNKMDMKLNSKLVLETRGFYNDTAIPNSGPTPPVVGKETTYTIHWKATNVSNGATGAKAEAVLPTGVTFTGKFLPEDGHLTYNQRNNSIIWELGTLDAGIGIVSSAPEIAFQIKFLPSPNQIGKVADLVGPAVFSAKDAFTGEDLSFTAEKKTTALREDVNIGADHKVLAQ
jgi:hypothetical protein